MQKLQSLMIQADVSVKSAWKALSDNGYRILFVVDDHERLLGALTDGDVRRWILGDHSILEPVHQVMKKDPVVFHEGDETDENQLKEQFVRHRVECIPVIDHNQIIKKVVFWDDLFQPNQPRVTQNSLKNYPVVMMAGGIGQRLKPFTNIIPKPLVPYKNKSIIEVIMDKFTHFGVEQFFLTLKYKANMMKAYFQDTEVNYNIHFHVEDVPCGTAGAIAGLKEHIHSTFIVSNADILIDADYTDIVKFHEENKNLITLVCSMKHTMIPYGVVEINNGGVLKSISEKPELDHLVLTGLYIVEPALIELIPQDRVFHMTHLIEKVRQEGGKIGVYPIAESSWTDIGETSMYQKFFKDLK